MRLLATTKEIGIFEMRPACFPAALLSAALFWTGCAGTDETPARQPEGTPAPRAEIGKDDILLPVDPPAWFASEPQAGGRYRFISGTGVSLAWSEEALRRAEADAMKEAAGIAGSFVVSEWRQRTLQRDGGDGHRFREEVEYLTRVISEEPIIGASVARSECVQGERMRAGDVAGAYFQGFVMIRVPEKNFSFTPERCLEQARAALVRDDFERARLTLAGAALFWPGDPEILESLARVQEQAGLLGDALQTFRQLAAACPADDHGRIRDEIDRLERRHAGGEFSCLEKSLRRVLAATADPERLRLVPLGDRAEPGGFLDYTVHSDREYAYWGIWIDAEGCFTFPAHAADSGKRLGNDDGARLASLDAGGTASPHLFVLVADADGRGWFEERGFPRDLVDHRAADPAGRLPHRDLAALIADLEKRGADGHLVTAYFAFEVGN